MTTPTKTQLDQEHTTSVTYEMVALAPHITVDEQHRRLIRECFESCAQLMRTKLQMALGGSVDVQLRATRHSPELGRLDVFDPDEYPQD